MVLRDNDRVLALLRIEDQTLLGLQVLVLLEVIINLHFIAIEQDLNIRSQILLNTI